MLTCQTPSQDSPSQHKVQLHIDGVTFQAPSNYTYNEDPLIHNVQPTRSFIRCVPHTPPTTPTPTQAQVTSNSKRGISEDVFQKIRSL